MLNALSGLTVAIISMASATAAGNAYHSAKWNFTTNYPAGWIVGELSLGDVVVSAVAPPPESGVTCNTTAEAMALSQKLSQAEINKMNQDPFPPQFWLSSVYGRFSNIAIERSGNRKHPSGVEVQEAVAAFESVNAGKSRRAKAHTTIFITPGKTFSMTCITLEAKFGKYRNDFAAAIDSFRIGQAGLSAQTNSIAPAVTNVMTMEMTSLIGRAAESVSAETLQ